MVTDQMKLGRGDVAAKAKILAAFWHRTRRTYVPLTAAEVAARAGTDASGQSVGNHLAALASSGFARSERLRGSEAMLWELTSKGMRWADLARGDNNAL